MRLQVDHSACSKPPVDIDLKVAVLILKHNSMSTGGFELAEWSPCIQEGRLKKEVAPHISLHAVLA